jgi:hypothetical protein
MVNEHPEATPVAGASGGRFLELGTTALAKLLGLQPWRLSGHWCSRCEGVWYVYTLEARCPQCGNRLDAGNNRILLWRCNAQLLP